MTEFERAFARARKAGKQTFTYKGRVYSTETASNNKVNNRQVSRNRAIDSSRGNGVLRRTTPTYVEDLDNFLEQTQRQHEARQAAKRMKRGSGVMRNDRVRNKEAIIQHKVANNVTDPYVIVDKANKTMEVYSGNKLLEQHEILTGQRAGDGRYQIPEGQSLQYWQMPRTSPAGIFTLGPRSTSPYYQEPMFHLLDNGKLTYYAMHAPAGPDRIARFNNGTLNDNMASYGCFTLPLGVSTHLYNDKVIGAGDTAYVIPEMPGNYIARQGHHLQTIYGGNNPQQFTSPDGFQGPITYNESW